jgi:hypothetical protein
MPTKELPFGAELIDEPPLSKHVPSDLKSHMAQVVSRPVAPVKRPVQQVERPIAQQARPEIRVNLPEIRPVITVQPAETKVIPSVHVAREYEISFERDDKGRIKSPIRLRPVKAAK